MPSPSSLLILALTVVMTLWPIAFLAAVAYHAFARRWRRVGQAALLLPLWSVAASVGLVQMPRLMAALDAPALTRNLVYAGTAIAFALCCAVLAWALLLRSFGARDAPVSDRLATGKNQRGAQS